MPINQYFDTGALIGANTEQQLLDDLIVEAVSIHGLSVYYLPRTNVAMDYLYLEDPLVKFEDAVEIEVYLKSFDQFQGDGDFMSAMGLEIRNQAVFSVAMTRFTEELGPNTSYSLDRPREGDLIWYPLNQKLFEIKYVDKFAMHYPLGSLHVWDFKTELWEYSNQQVNTGIAAIDAVMSLSTVNGASNTAPDPMNDANNISQEVDGLLDFDELDVFSESKYGVATK